MRVGEGWLVPTGGGSPVRLGEGLSNMAPVQFTADSRHVLFLGGYNPAAAQGVLFVLPLGQAVPAAGEKPPEPLRLGDAVSYVVPSKDGRSVAFVDGGALKVGPLPQGPFREVAPDVSTAAFTPDGKTLAFRRRASAGGALSLVAVEGEGAPRKLADGAGWYELSPDSRHVAYQVQTNAQRALYDLMVAPVAAPTGKAAAAAKPKAAGTNVRAFRFSPDGKWLARVEEFSAETETGALVLGPAEGGPGRTLGKRAQDLTFAPDSRALAFLDNFDSNTKVGRLTHVALPDGAPRVVRTRVPTFIFGKDAQRLAFVARVPPDASVDLFTWKVGDEGPTPVDKGVFGYAFTPDDRFLVYRTRCIREGRACELRGKDLAAGPEAQPQTWVEGVFGYKLSDDGRRLLVSYARMDKLGYDVAVYNRESRQHRTLQRGVTLPAAFLSDDGTKVAYLVPQGGEPGVYVASDVP